MISLVVVVAQPRVGTHACVAVSALLCVGLAYADENQQLHVSDPVLSYDVVVDCIGKANHEDLQELSLKALRAGGHYCDLNGDMVWRSTSGHLNIRMLTHACVDQKC